MFPENRSGKHHCDELVFESNHRVVIALLVSGLREFGEL